MNEVSQADKAGKSRGRGKGRMNPADVANHLVRCMLADASEFVGSWTEADRERTLTYFGHRCAFTGTPYDPASFVWDHLVPHNKESCGLHTYGNLVPATKLANSAKADKDFRDFLRRDRVGLGDTPAAVREERIRKLETFQRESGYQQLSESLEGLRALCMEQYERIKTICQENREAMRAHLAPLTAEPKHDIRQQVRTDAAADATLPIDYEVSPPPAFLARFLEAGVAYIEEHYSNGRTEIRRWEARKLTPQSNLVANIRSRPEYRSGSWQAAGLTKLVLRLTHPALNNR